MQRLISTLLLVALCIVLAQSQNITEIKSRYLYGSATYNGLTIPYRYFVPQGYSPTNKYAIITFLHGIGERGSDNSKQLIRAPIILANDTVQNEYKFFIVAPQCPSNLEWQKNSTLRGAVKVAADNIIAQYAGIDPNHRFIMGLSLGSFGTWTTVNQFPGIYKKVVPIAGGYSSITASNFRQSKVWAFHSTNDPTVNVTTTLNTINKLRNDGQSVLFTDPNAGHIIDDDALLRYPLVDWLFNDTDTGLPRTCFDYLGCFVDNTTLRDLSGHTWYNSNMTIELCHGRCKERNFAYFGVQYARQCFCDNNYGMYGAGLESSCNRACMGNPLQVCGGGNRNSVYRIIC